MAPGPDLRIGDAERDVTTRQLRECFAQGRLSMDEFNDRLGKALAATTQPELDRLTHDLPPAMPTPAPLPHTAGYRGDPRYAGNPRRHHGGGPGGGSGCGTGMRSRLMTVLAGLLVLWLVLSTVIAPLRFFPFGGRLAVLLVVLGVLRGIIRRIFRLGRR
jgi:hypothetical protein